MFKSKVLLAPMAGITDIAFRELCVEYGASSTCTELISCKAILQKNKNTLNMLKKGKEKPFSIQLFGSQINDFVEAAKFIQNKCDTIDINIGCPAKKVMKTGAGSTLLLNPKKCGEIIKEIKKVVKIPVSAKIRLGVDKEHYTGIKVAKECQNAGAAFITVHGRYASQGYSGKADWKKIKEIKDAVKVPVVGNGDVTDARNAEHRLAESGVDFIAIGRGASGNPFIFKQINHFLETGEELVISQKEKLDAFQKYLKLCTKYKVPLIHQKLQAQHWIKGIKGSAKAREEISLTKTQKELKEIIIKIFQNLQIQ